DFGELYRSMTTGHAVPSIRIVTMRPARVLFPPARAYEISTGELCECVPVSCETRCRCQHPPRCSWSSRKWTVPPRDDDSRHELYRRWTYLTVGLRVLSPCDV